MNMIEKLILSALLWGAFFFGRWWENRRTHRLLKEIRLIVADELWKMIWKKP
jgi:hypothetical protein